MSTPSCSVSIPVTWSISTRWMVSSASWPPWAGLGHLARLYHMALETGGLIQVFDIWESAKSFQAFAATLVPVFAELGVDRSGPQVSPIHNIIVG